jgi:DNA-binding NarL/FixJ family response regulator
VRVLLVDDHELVWNGTRRLLQTVLEDFDPPRPLVFSAVHSVAAALAHTDPPPELILLDYHLPGAHGLQALLTLRHAFEAAPVCMLSAESDRTSVMEVLENGAAGFIPKHYRESEMAHALRQVLSHRIYVPGDILFAQEAERVARREEVHSEDLAAFLRHELSPRQRDVLRLTLRGLSNKRIASELDIAEATVKVHLTMVFRALGVRTRVEAMLRVLGADAAGALG